MLGSHRRLARLVACVTAIACGGGGDGGTILPPVVTVATVSLSRDTASLVPGATIAFVATAKDAAGNILVRTITWSTADASVAGVGSDGTVTGVALGTAKITAEAEGRSASAQVTVKDGSVVGVAGGIVTGLGGLATLTIPANAVDNGTMITIESSTGGPSDQRVVPRTQIEVGPATATLRAPATLRVRYDPTRLPSGPPERLLTLQQSAGQAWQEVAGSAADLSAKTVTAQVNALGRYAVLSAPFVVSVTVVPNGVTMQVADLRQLSAAITSASGGILPGRDVTWTSSNPALVSVSPAGQATGVAIGGPVTVTATCEGIAGTAVIVVAPPPVAAVTVTPAASTVAQGATVQLTSTERDASGNVLTGRARSWSSSSVGVATVSLNGLVTGVAPGTVTVTSVSENVTGSATVTVTPPSGVNAVAVSPGAETIRRGWTRQLQWSVSASGGANTAVSFASQNPSVATVSPSGLITGVAAGFAAITVTAIADPSKSATYTSTVVSSCTGLFQIPIGYTIPTTTLCGIDDTFLYAAPVDTWIQLEAYMTALGSCGLVLGPASYVVGNSRYQVVYTRNCYVQAVAFAFVKAGLNYATIMKYPNFPSTSLWTYSNATVTSIGALPLCTPFTGDYGVTFAIQLSATCAQHTVNLNSRMGTLNVSASSASFGVTVDLVSVFSNTVVATATSAGPGQSASLSRAATTSEQLQVRIRSSPSGAAGAVTVTVAP